MIARSCVNILFYQIERQFASIVAERSKGMSVSGKKEKELITFKSASAAAVAVQWGKLATVDLEELKKNFLFLQLQGLSHIPFMHEVMLASRQGSALHEQKKISDWKNCLKLRSCPASELDMSNPHFKNCQILHCREGLDDDWKTFAGIWQDTAFSDHFFAMLEQDISLL